MEAVELEHSHLTVLEQPAPVVRFPVAMAGFTILENMEVPPPQVYFRHFTILECPQFAPPVDFSVW